MPGIFHTVSKFLWCSQCVAPENINISSKDGFSQFGCKWLNYFTVHMIVKSGSQLTVAKPNQSWPITRDASLISQSELKANACNRRKGRETHASKARLVLVLFFIG